MIAQFALRLICGMSLMWAVMPRAKVTTGFFRIQMLVVLGLAVLAALTLQANLLGTIATDAYLGRMPAIGLCVAIAVAAYLGSIFWTLARRKAGAFFVFLIAVTSALTLAGAVIPRAEFETMRGGLLALSEWSSSAVLGSMMTGMLLGHWYLTAPTMSIAPLSRLNTYVGISAAVRLVISAIGLSMAGNEIFSGSYVLWLSLRWLAGILGPLVVSVMVWRILKYRNTQSATGVLFVGVILTFIGEMCSLLLYRELHLPV